MNSDKSNTSNNMNDNVVQLRKSFLCIHRQRVPYRRGIVFIGNSRIGKSTLSAALSGMNMRVRLYDKILKIQPESSQDREKKNLIQHSKTSVTSSPNIHQTQVNGDNYSLIDLPGFNDTSYYKQLCNQYYIQDILQQLQQVLFIMVIQVHSQHKQIKSKQLEMMQRFRLAFPANNLGQSKQNLVIVVNFVQNLTDDKQREIRRQIRENVLGQLQAKEEMKKFYYNCLNEDSRVLLVKRVQKGDVRFANGDLHKGVCFKQPRLLQFMNRNIKRISKSQLSSYKINLTKQNNQKSEQLRKLLLTYCKYVIKSIEQKFQNYKKLFSYLLSIMEQSKGGYLRLQDFKIVGDYYKVKDIGGFYGQLKVFQHPFLKMDSDCEGTQECVLEAVFLFNQMSMMKQFNDDDLKGLFGQILNKIFRFMNIMHKLAKKLYKSQDFLQIDKINQNIWKSINIQVKSYLYLNDNVQNFMLSQQTQDHVEYFAKNNFTQTNNLYTDSMCRISTFKQPLMKYMKAMVERCKDQPVNKVDLQVLIKFKQACEIMKFTDLKKHYLVLLYKTCHQKLYQVKLIQFPAKFKQALELCQDTYSKLNEDERQQLSKWQQSGGESQVIRNKAYLQVVRFLAKTNYNKIQVIRFYLNINCYYEELILVLRQLSQMANFDKAQLYDICFQVAQKLVNNYEFSIAQQCYLMAKNIYTYQDKQKVTKAKIKYIQIYSMIYGSGLDAKIKQYVNSEPWSNISNKDYKQLLQIALRYSSELVNQADRKQTFSQNVTSPDRISKGQRNNAIHYSQKVNNSKGPALIHHTSSFQPSSQKSLQQRHVQLNNNKKRSMISPNSHQAIKQQIKPKHAFKSMNSNNSNK